MRHQMQGVVQNSKEDLDNKRKNSKKSSLSPLVFGIKTIVQTSTQCTPYNLVFGSEVISPIELQLPSLRISSQLATPEENVKVRFAKLKALDEKRLAVQQMLEIHQP